MSLIELNTAPRRIADNLGLALGTVLGKIVHDLNTKIVTKCPVDTGRLRASFLTTIGAPTNEAPPPGEYGPPSPPKGQKYDGTKPIFIASALAYAEAIENGHSTQAPAGMVAISVIELEEELRQL